MGSLVLQSDVERQIALPVGAWDPRRGRSLAQLVDVPHLFRRPLSLNVVLDQVQFEPRVVGLDDLLRRSLDGLGLALALQLLHGLKLDGVLSLVQNVLLLSLRSI